MPSQIVLTPLLLTLLILSFEVKSAFITILTQPKFRQPPKTFEELADTPDYTIGFGLINDSAEGKLFQDLGVMGNAVVKKLSPRIVEHYPHFDVCDVLDWAMNGN